MLKGWLDRVLVPGLGFLPPGQEGGRVRPGLTHVRRLAVFTSHGTSWWVAKLTGDAGRITLMRGLRLLLAPRARARFVTLRAVHAAGADRRAAHLDRVAAITGRLFAG
jgi:putative NADPH-quinone reductase